CGRAGRAAAAGSASPVGRPPVATRLLSLHAARPRMAAQPYGLADRPHRARRRFLHSAGPALAGNPALLSGRLALAAIPLRGRDLRSRGTPGAGHGFSRPRQEFHSGLHMYCEEMLMGGCGASSPCEPACSRLRASTRPERGKPARMSACKQDCLPHRRSGRLSLLLALLACSAGAQSFDGQAALEATRRLGSFGPRPAGSAAHRKLRQWLAAELRPLKCDVAEDSFTATTPLGPRQMTNLIAKFPGRSGRIVVISGHY